jgi:hypothetical protein
MPDSAPVSVIVAVPAWPMPSLPLTLASARTQTVLPLEVLLFVNPSALTEEMKTNMAVVPAGSVTTTVAPRNTTRAGLFAEGERAARGEYIVWLGGDALMDPRAIEMQLAAMAALGGPGVVSCEPRVHAGPEPRVSLPPDVALPSVERRKLAVLRSLLSGQRQTTGLMAHRSCVETAGGHDAAFGYAHEIDVAIRLASRFPFAHVDAPAVRLLAAAPSGHEMFVEQADVYRRVLAVEGDSLAELGSLFDVLGAAHRGLLLPDVRRRTEALVRTEDLAIAVAGRHADAGDIAGRLGVPGAAAFAVASGSRDPVVLLEKAAAHSEARWLMLADTAVPPDPDTLALQLLHAEAAGLDVCPAEPDGAVWRPAASPSLIAGTLFRSAALAQLNWRKLDSERGFWLALLSRHSIGGFRAVARETAAPDVAKVVAACVDEPWYMQTNRDVAAAGMNAVEHFLHFGWRERRRPNAWFDTGAYLARFPEILKDAAGVNPLEHFLAGVPRAVYPSQHPFDIARYVRWRLAGRKPEFADILAVLVPGWANVAGASNTAASVETVAPGLAMLIRSLPAEIETLETVSRLVDADWYAKQYPDVATARIPAADHFTGFGLPEGREPNAWFDSGWYFAHNPGSRDTGCSAVEHFVRYGAAKGAQPHPGFHLEWYARRYLPAGTPLGPEVLVHFLIEGAKNGHVPHPRLDRDAVHRELASLPPQERVRRIAELHAMLPGEAVVVGSLIDRAWYASVCPGSDDPMSHYLRHGIHEPIDPNPWFDARWYMRQYPSVRKSELQPLLQFVRTGAAEGLRPGPHFDHVWYGKRYLGAHSGSADALLHFLAVGILEGAVPHPRLDTPEYRREVTAAPVWARTSLLQNLLRKLESAERTANELVDAEWYRAAYGLDSSEYRTSGWREGRNPSAWFDTGWYLLHNSDVRDLCPLEHFVLRGGAEGRDPHPLFRAAWYARHYLGSSQHGAEALRHFMKIGMETGNVPDPRLATPSVRSRLSSVPAAKRSELLHRLVDALYRAQASAPVRWAAEDADLWPFLLTRTFPEFTTGTLLLVDERPAAASVAEGAALALPAEESPLFGFVREGTLTLADSLGAEAVRVVLELPRQIENLRTLLREIPCRRAALLSPELLHSPVVRAVRNADVPVFTREASAAV